MPVALNDRFAVMTGWLLLTAGTAALQAQMPEKVEFNARVVDYDAKIAAGAYRLIGNVIFTHEGALMMCDSAYFYSSTNSLDAFKNVHINQGDSLHLYGEYLHYEGNTKMARVRRNVRLEGRNTTLRTGTIDFDLSRNIGYYTDHADIESGENRLSSREGYYYSEEEIYFFRDSVQLINPDYTILSDTLQYRTGNSTAYFLGPTEIISDSSYIYCENGWYNTETDQSMLKTRALVRNKTQTVTSDSMYYEKQSGYGEAYGNTRIEDTEQNIVLTGNLAILHQNEESAMITGDAVLIFITEGDSIYVHADTLRSMQDSAGISHMKAYYGVRMFKSNFQGKCDSLYYCTSDSILRLYGEPVLWSGMNQLSSEYIEVRTRNRKVSELHMEGIALIINQEDSSKFNQIKGRTMTCYFRDNDLYRIDAKGNGQTVYYAKDKGELVGVNIAESSDLTILLEDDEIDQIRFMVKPNAILYPLGKAPEESLILKDFKWEEAIRPKDRYDILRKN